jgi:hypothetical protein
MASKSGQRLPAADWVRARVGRRPYVLVSHVSSKVPGMHPPLHVVKNDASMRAALQSLSAPRAPGTPPARTMRVPGRPYGRMVSRGPSNRRLRAPSPGPPAAAPVTPVIVVYSSAATPAKVLELEAHVDDLNQIALAMRRSLGYRDKVLIALESATKFMATVVKEEDPHIEPFVGRTFASKMNIARNITKLPTPLPRERLQNARVLLAQLTATPGKLNGRSQMAVRALRDALAVAGGKPTGRLPKKRNTLNAATQWTTEMYRNVQAYKRQGANTPNARRLNYMLNTYMSKFALRAPQKPPKVRNLETGSEMVTLYRGVGLTNAQLADAVNRGGLPDRGYVAMSRSRRFATNFGGRDELGNTLVMRLREADVPRGTPWLWFAGRAETIPLKRTAPALPYRSGVQLPIDPHGRFKRHAREFVNATMPEEDEVLLPPGTLVFKGAPRQQANRTTWLVDVRFQPAPRRARHP